MTARSHHYVPRCYLNNFAVGGKIVAIDVKVGKRFTTNTKNVAQERDFNKIESDTLPSDALETAYGQFESELAPILTRLALGNSFSQDDDDFSYVLTLISVLAVRNPRFRGNFREFQNNVRQQMMAIVTHTKERWEGQVAKARAAGFMEGISDVPYEQIRASVERRDFEFITTPHEHAQTELPTIDSLVAHLAERNWRWVRAKQNAGPFITCDHPVCLNRKMQSASGMRMPIGYGQTGTTVFFPLAPGLAVLGEYDGQTDDLAADIFDVADFNRRVANNAVRHVFVRDDTFQIFDGSNLFGIADLLERTRAPNSTRQT